MLKTDKITTLLWKKIRELQQQVNEPADAVWGNITGTLSNQTDLQNALNGKANTSHSHSISNVTNLQSTLDNKETKFQVIEIRSDGYSVPYKNTNAILFIDLRGVYDPPNNVIFQASGESTDTESCICFMKILGIEPGITLTVQFEFPLDEETKSLSLTSSDNKKSYTFIYYKGYWRIISTFNGTL